MAPPNKDATEGTACAKTPLLPTLPHEIRTAMGEILGFSELALRTGLDARQREYLERIRAAALGMIDVIGARAAGVALSSPATLAPPQSVTADPSPIPATETVARALPLPAVRVLVVEHDEANRVAVRELLESCGAVVEITGDGAEAATLASAPEHLFDAVLMALRMPGLDGYETARRIRANPATALVPIIAMTAHGLPWDRQRCMEVGINDHMATPIDGDRLAGVIAHWVTRSLATPHRPTPRPQGAAVRRRRSDGPRRGALQNSSSLQQETAHD